MKYYSSHFNRLSTCWSLRQRWHTHTYISTMSLLEAMKYYSSHFNRLLTCWSLRQRWHTHTYISMMSLLEAMKYILKPFQQIVHLLESKTKMTCLGMGGRFSGTKKCTKCPPETFLVAFKNDIWKLFSQDCHIFTSSLYLELIFLTVPLHFIADDQCVCLYNESNINES